MADSPWILFVLPFRHVLQHHFKKKLSHQIQYWLRINCGRAFAWEMIYPLESSNSSGGRNILLIKRCFYFWRALLVITYPLFMIILLCPPIYLYPRKWHDHKKFWRFYQVPPPPQHFLGVDDAMETSWLYLSRIFFDFSLKPVYPTILTILLINSFKFIVFRLSENTFASHKIESHFHPRPPGNTLSQVLITHTGRGN